MIQRIIRDPLFVFLLLSIAIFFYYNVIIDPEETDDNVVVLTDGDIDRLVDIYQRTWSSPPDSLSLRRLIDQEIRNEIFYNEGLKMNLDHNDEIIRRRLVQKYEFLIKDLSDNVAPTEEQLKSFYQEHIHRYQSQATYTFEQYYFSPDRSGAPDDRARTFYGQVSQGSNPLELKSDPMHIGTNQSSKSINQLMQSFGKKFSEQITASESLGWQGPIESGYGWHVVKLIAREEPMVIPYDEVVSQVSQDLRSDLLSSYNERIYDALRSDYRVQWDVSKWSEFVQ